MVETEQKAKAFDPAAPIPPQIAGALRVAIVRCELRPGHRVSEAEIAARYGVSRQPVREAFIRLAGEGLVTVLPHRGTTIRRIGIASVIEARFVREAIEADIVRVLAADPGRVPLDGLRAQIARQFEASAGDPAGFIALDEAFHRGLAEAAGKGGLWARIQGLKSQMDRVRYLALGQFPVRRLVEQHAAIVEAIARGEEPAAEAALRRHLRAILSDLPHIVHANPDLFDAPQSAGEDRVVTIEGGLE